MLSVLSELLDKEASASVIRFYESCVLALCRGDWSASPGPKLLARRKRPFGAGKVRKLARQIAQFVLAGIELRVHATDKTSINMDSRD